MMGTSVGGDLLEDVEDEADKHDLQGRARAKITEGKKKGRKALEGVRGQREEDEEFVPQREKVPRRRRAVG